MSHSNPVASGEAVLTEEEKQLGTALGWNAGIGNLGVGIMQAVVPLVMALQPPPLLRRIRPL